MCWAVDSAAMQATTQARWRTGAATAAGTCGELAQGVLPSGQRFHVTCPIDRYASASVRVFPARVTTIVGLPEAMWKTRRAMLRAARLLELPPTTIEIEHHSELAPAKGLASSTADILAAVRALADAHAITVDDVTLGRLAAAVEPTDGVMYDGIVAVDQHAGTPLRRWTWWPQFTIAMVTPPGRRETGRRGAPVSARHAAEYADLLATLDEAVRHREADAFAQQATRSARLSEAVVPNPVLTTLLPHLGALGAAGICVGHSGTVCGLLFTGDHATAKAVESQEPLRDLVGLGCRVEVAHTPRSPTR